MKSLSFVGRYHAFTSLTIAGLADVLSEQGRFREATLLAAAAVDSAEKGGAAAPSNSLAAARSALGSSLVAQEKWTEAVSVYEKRHQDLATDPKVLRQFGAGEINWAYALVKTGAAQRAVPMLAELLDTRQKQVGDKDRAVAELRGYLALALA